MRDLLDRAERDQRRLRTALGQQVDRLARATRVLTKARDRAGRVYVVAEPPLHLVGEFLVREHLEGLSAQVLRFEVAAIDAQPLRPEDVLLPVAMSGSGVVMPSLLAKARAGGTAVILIAGSEARRAYGHRVPTTLSVPTRGARSTCEALFLVLRILGRLVKAHAPRETARVEHTRVHGPAKHALDGRLRFARGYFPDTDEGAAHPILSFNADGVVFLLDPRDDASSTLEVGDKLWVRLEVAGEREPLRLRGRVNDVNGVAESGEGVHVTLHWVVDGFDRSAWRHLVWPGVSGEERP